MDDRMFKVFHWHVATWVHLIVSNEPFECPPTITLIQHQVRRTLGFLWRVSLVGSFGCRRRKVLRFDGWRSNLDENQVHCWVVQGYYNKKEFWNLGRRSLARLLLLGTSTSRKVTRVYRAGYTLPFSNLDDRFLDVQGSGIVQDLNILFTLSTTGNYLLLVFFHDGQPYDEENRVSYK